MSVYRALNLVSRLGRGTASLEAQFGLQQVLMLRITRRESIGVLPGGNRLISQGPTASRVHPSKDFS
jgi:hypothetical protein